MRGVGPASARFARFKSDWEDRMYRTIAAVAVVLGATIAPSLAAADHARSGTDPQGRSTISAQEFLSEAAAGNRFEIVTGQLAQQRAESSDIKALGAEFVDDHTALLEQGAK